MITPPPDDEGPAPGPESEPKPESGRDPRRRRRRRRWAIGVLVALTSVAVLAVTATARLFLWPPSDTPRPSAAIVVLSGDLGDRLPAADRLVAQGMAPVLVHAGTPDSQRVFELCRGEVRIAAEVVCLQPNPDNTRAEARAVAELARSRHWGSLIVVTSKYHVFRAGILFGRCYGGTLHMVGTDPISRRQVITKQIPHEWGGLVYLTVHRGC